MSRQVKEIICKELTDTLRDVDAAFVIDPTALDGITGNALRRDLSAAKIQVQLVKNSLAKRVVAGTKLESVGSLLAGNCALAWGGDSIVDVAKLLVAKVKTLPKLIIKGAVMEGNVLDATQAAELSKMPTKAELRSSLVAAVASPGRKIAAAVLAAGSKIASQLKSRIEALEKTEAAPPPAAPAAPTPAAA